MMRSDKDTRHNRRPATRHGVALALALGLALVLTARSATVLVAAPATSGVHDGPTFAIVNPLYINSSVAEGPINTVVTIQATAGWTAGAGVTLGVVQSGQACTAANQIPAPSLTPITVDGKGAFSALFSWPAAAEQLTAYSICANETGVGTQVGASSNTFDVLSASAPAFQLAGASTSATIHAGDTVSLTGTNWLPPGQTVSFVLRSVQPGLPDVALASADNAAVTSDNNGNFQVNIKLPTGYQGQWEMVAEMGKGTTTGNQTFYPLTAASPSLNIAAPLPVTPTMLPTVTSTAVVATATANTRSNAPGDGQNTKLLIILLGLIAAILLGSGIVVFILALRGRELRHNAEERADAPWNGAGRSATNWDDTTASGPWDDGWQSPSGQPWSGRESGRINGPPSALDDEDDPYRTRLGNQSSPPVSRPNMTQPSGPPPPRPTNPSAVSRHVPPPSRPAPPPGWGEDQDTMGNLPTGPQRPPPRR